jgi:hypothetical protein
LDRKKKAELQKELDDYGIYLEDLIGFLFNDPEKRGWKNLAADANLSYSTIRNLAMGDTKRPQELTVRKLMKAFRYRNAWIPEDTPTLPFEINVKKKAS